MCPQKKGRIAISHAYTQLKHTKAHETDLQPFDARELWSTNS